MTKQEQIEKIQEIINDCYVVDSYIAAEGSEGGYIDTEEAAKAIVKAGYGDISGYETEREMLGSLIKVLKQRLNNKYVEIDNLNRDYRDSFERLKVQEREIDSLREDNINLKEELYELHDELDIARAKEDKTTKQAQIDVLKKLRSKIADKESLLQSYIADGCLTIEDMYTEIDELITELNKENEQ